MSDITWTNCKVRLGDLRKWEGNPAEISKAAAGRLVESFNEFGQAHVILIEPDYQILDGHQRDDVWGAKFGDDFMVDCRMASRKFTDEERRKFVIYLRSGTTGSYDWDTLSGWDAKELIEWGLDDTTLRDWKRDVTALDNLLESEKQEPVDAEPQIDRADELNEKWQVKTGDLWQIGEHRLLCGDSTKREDVERLTNGNPYCVLTDPPYNIGFNYNGIDDKMTSNEYAEFCQKWFDVVKDAECLIFSPGPKNTRLYPIPRDTGYWLKRNASAGASAFNLRTIEPLLIYGKIGQKRNFDLFDYSSGFTDELRAAQRAAQVEDKHPPAKPIGLWLDILDMLPDIQVLDLFSGNGTTFMACQNKGRVAIGIELDPSYCAVILERMATAFPELEIKRITEQ